MAVKIGIKVSPTVGKLKLCLRQVLFPAVAEAGIANRWPRSRRLSGGSWHRDQVGFSLVEMLVVIAIASLLLSMAVIEFYGFMTNSKLNEYRDNILSYVQEARTRSITSVPYGIAFAANSYQFVRLQDGTCSVTVATVCTADSDCLAGETCIQNFMYDDGEPSVVVGNASLGNYSLNWNGCSSLADTTLWFDRRGIPRCVNWSLAPGTITITSGSRSKTLVIDSTGKVKYE